MLGYIRLLLAFAVLSSHVGLRWQGLNPGVIAVVVFYLLAGMVVTHLWHDILPQTEAKMYYFFRDRLLRIFPLYLYTLVLILLFLFISGFGQPHFTWLAMLNNLLIIPLNYYMYLDNTILSEPSWWLIPQAWSLGVELQAYLLLPLTLMFKPLRVILLAASLMVYMAANLSWLQPDHFGYRLLPGVLFIFMLGSVMQETRHSKIYWPLLSACCALFIVIYGVFEYTQQFPQAYTRETLIGLLIGIPIIALANRSALRLPFNKLAGALSYGVFLNHFLIIWVLQYYTPALVTSGIFYWLALVGLSVLLAYIGVRLIDANIHREIKRHNCF